MSIKTLRKRIALVAVSALGVGLLSVAPASAAAGDFSMGTTASATNYGVLSKNTAGTEIEMLLNGQVQIDDDVSIDAGDNTDVIRLVITQGSGSFTYAECTTACTAQDVATAANGQSVSWTATNNTNSTGGYARTYFRPSAVGKVVIQYRIVDTSAGTTSVEDTLTINVVASATSSKAGALDLSNTECARVSSATATIPTNGIDATTSNVANGSYAWVAINLEDALGENVDTGSLVVTSSSSDVQVEWNASAPSTTAGATAVQADNGASDYFVVGQGTANKAVSTTVTVTYNGKVVCSKSITIVGQLAKLTMSANAAEGLAVAPRGSTSGTHFYVLGYDAAGNRVATSGTPTVDAAGLNSVVTNVTVSGALAATDSPGKSGYFTCNANVSGSADVRVSHVDSVGATIYSNTVKARCGGTSAYKITASLDKATYVPGDVATLTLTATDSQGAPVADTTTLGTGAAIAGSNMTAVTAPSTADTFTGGVKTYKFVVGSTEGSYQMAVSTPAYAAYGVTDSTVAYKISTGTTTVTNTEVLAAIVKLIASINKQIRALQKSLRR